MKNFLEYVAEDILRKHGHDLSRLTVVFPNKRASLFLNDHLARLARRPLWSPAAVTISDLFRQHSRRQVADDVKLVCDLHKSFTSATGIDETLDHFFGWGQMLLADFDDIDKQLADADHVFRNLADLRELDDDSFLTPGQREVLKHFFSNFTDGRDTELKQRFLRLWRNMAAIYHDFNRRLESQQLAYEGALYKEVVSRPGDLDFSGDTYLFIGFNVLMPVEQRLFTLLMKQHKARFYWDFDHYYMQPNANGNATAQYQNEAGQFVGRNMSHFPNELDADSSAIYDNFRRSKQVTIAAASTENIQARYVSSWLRSTRGAAPSGEEARQTAVVLCNEALLPAVVNALPPDVGAVNITTGYPLAQSPVASLVNLLLALRRDGYDQSRSHFRWRQVIALLRHPYLDGASPCVAQLRRQLEEERNYFPTHRQLSADALTTLLFAPPQPLCQCENLLQWLCDVMKAIARNPADDVLREESIFTTYTRLNRLLSLARSGDMRVDINTLQHLVAQLMQQLSVPLHGEPAEGLQVMGLLETRNLDFRHLLILSAQEGNLPRGVNDSSLIPYSLRRAYGLTTPDHKVAIYAYYFLRLIQRADDVTIVYNSSTAEGQKGEKSRFLLQLMAESPHSVRLVTLQGGQDSTPRQPQPVANGAQLPAMLSPTAVVTWLRCPLRFHYRYVCQLHEPEEADEGNIDNRIFGNIFHEAAQTIYSRLAEGSPRGTEGGRLLTRGRIEATLKNRADVERAVDEAIAKHLFRADERRLTFKPRLNGLQLINREVIIHYLLTLLRTDCQLAPFSILGLEQLVSMEIHVPMPADGGNATVTVGGLIDRLDMVTDDAGRPHIRVVDYKTGAHRLKPLPSVEAVFSPDHLKAHSDYYLQAMLYALIVARRHPGIPVAPALLFVQHAAAPGYDPVLRIGRDAVDDISVLAQPFGQMLADTVSRMFCRDIPLQPTSDRQRCLTCPFRQLCY